MNEKNSRGSLADRLHLRADRSPTPAHWAALFAVGGASVYAALQLPWIIGIPIVLLVPWGFDALISRVMRGRSD